MEPLPVAGSTIKMAFSRIGNQFYVGVFYPDGNPPWVYVSKAATEDDLLTEYKKIFYDCVVEVISIEEHNRLKAEFIK